MLYIGLYVVMVTRVRLLTQTYGLTYCTRHYVATRPHGAARLYVATDPILYMHSNGHFIFGKHAIY